jgi:hypothetical protein
MSDITDVNHIECNTVQDVFDKYTSKEAKQAYSYRLCEVTMNALSGTNYDDYSCVEPTKEDIAKVNQEIKANIDSDLRRVVNLMYGECSSYVADMTKKGVMQMLSATDLRRIKRLLSGFDETYDIHIKSAPKGFIHNIPDRELNEGNEQINHYNLIFPISSDCVFEYIAPIRDSLEKLDYRIKTVITDCLMDTLIEAKTPRKDKPYV